MLWDLETKDISSVLTGGMGSDLVGSRLDWKSGALGQMTRSSLIIISFFFLNKASVYFTESLEEYSISTCLAPHQEHGCITESSEVFFQQTFLEYLHAKYCAPGPQAEQ